jgi:potassium-transporting ATPase ATP-binding subunit
MTMQSSTAKPTSSRRAQGIIPQGQLGNLIAESLRKLNPVYVAKNPVMFVVEIGTLITLYLTFERAFTGQSFGYELAITVLLLLTVLFATFAESVAEARGKAQAASLRAARADTPARRVLENGSEETVSSTALRHDDLVRVAAGQLIPADGEIVQGLAMVDESAITGESAPVLREAGGDFSSVTGGTKVISDEITVRVTSLPGESFLDRMIALVEGASRQKTPNEIALSILLAGFTLIFVLVVVTLLPMAAFIGTRLEVTTLVALLVCLIPTTIGGLLPAIGIAGMDRALRANVIAKSGRAVEVAGDIDTLLLDKTGTITLGNRQATAFIPAPGITEERLARAAHLASLADNTPEGKSIVELAVLRGSRPEVGIRDRAEFIEFTAQTRMSGVNLPDGTQIRKGAPDRMMRLVRESFMPLPAPLEADVERVARGGGTPLVVTENGEALGVVALSDIVKTGIKERFAQLRRMGLRTVMITGDNPLTAKAIAAEAGVDDFLAEATPEDKMRLIKEEQQKGKLVAMMGDGTNDAPALAQADVGLAMNSGTQAAKEAGNMVDLDSDPTKLLEVVEIGKGLLITRGALTTFSIANDVAKYFAIIPAMFAGTIPALNVLDIMQLGSPNSAILSAVIFNALVIPLLIPVALRGVAYKPMGADSILVRNLLIYGLGGVIVPFIGIKLIDLALSLARV